MDARRRTAAGIVIRGRRSRWSVSVLTVVVALGFLGALTRPALADNLPPNDTARAMVLLLSLSHALAQKSGAAQAPVKPDAKSAPLAATETAPSEGVAAGVSAGAVPEAITGASAPEAQ
jgi:hypothetical protein